MKLLLSLVVTFALLWLAWPWLRPRLWPAAGPTWLVVLDGYHRLDTTLERQARTGEPILLITCPATGQPTAAQWARQREIALLHPQRPPLLVLQQGFDTATQAVALAQWLQHRQRQGQPAPQQLFLVSDAHHFPRASWAAQIAAGSSGSQVQPLPVRSGSAGLAQPAPWADRPSWRDALRLQLWRATGSTGAWLKPEVAARKRAACGQ